MKPLQAAKDEAVSILYSAIGTAYKEAGIKEEEVRESIAEPVEEHGDLSTSICFKISHKLKMAPHMVAGALLKQMGGGNLISRFKEEGGYINMYLDTAKYSEIVLGSILRERDEYCKSDIGKGTKAIVEFPSVNPNKPWHVGHLRNAILGDVISNLLSACSYKVEREDYINNLGLQIAESLWGYLNINKNADKKFDRWLGEQYVEVNRQIKEKGVEEEIMQLLKKIESGDTDDARISREVSERCVKAQYETAFNYGIYHDLLVWESDVVREKFLENALSILEKTGILLKPKEGKYAGCTVIDINKIKGFAEDFAGAKEEAKVLIRSNGTATYLAKDIAFHMWKFGMLKGFTYSVFIDKQPNGKPLFTTAQWAKEMDFGNVKAAVNIIGDEQRYPQLLLKAVFSLMGHNEIADNIHHISYGLVSLEGAAISGRTGTWVGESRSYTADDLLAEAEKKSLAIVKGNAKLSRAGSEEEERRIAHAVAISAIKFEYLRVAPEKKISFSWEKALNFDGNSGPYCMYSFARASSILEKAGFDASKVNVEDYAKIERGEEFELVKALGAAPDVVEKACKEYRPNVITDYLISLSSPFSRFYEKMPVLKGGESAQIRTAITFGFWQILKSMLNILGIEALERL